jgi:hypothetical protein
MHFSSSITIFPSSVGVIAATGQAPAHAPQPIHVSARILYAIFLSPYVNLQL